MDPFVGEIRLFAFNKVPTGWLACNGQTLQVTAYQALYTLLGTQYGGNGTTTFMLPDLRGRVPVHIGPSPTTNTPYTQGATGGAESVTLTEAQMPQHTHAVAAYSTNANTLNPNSAYPARLVISGSGTMPVPNIFVPPAAGQTAVTLAPSAIASTGGNQPHPNLQPYLAMNYCIAAAGIYPPRN